MKRIFHRLARYNQLALRYSTQFMEYLQTRFVTPRARIVFMQSIVIWLASFLVGIVAVVYARMFAWAEWGCLYWFEHYPKLAFLIFPLFFTLAWWFVNRFAPSARGSGIPQLMAAVDLANAQDKRFVGYFLSLKVMAIKIISSLLLVFGGGASGREGPTLQIAGSVFKVVQDWLPKDWPHVSERIMLMTGGAAGLSAAFNTPLGGIVFVVEELSKVHIARFRNFVFTGVIIAGMTAQWLNGSYLYLGFPKTAGGDVKVFALTMLIAILTGLAGVVFTKMVYQFTRVRERFFGRNSFVWYVAFLGLLSASLAYFVSPNAMGSGKEVMEHLLFEPDKTIDIATVAVRFLAPGISFSSGAAAGIFAPSLATGASIGGWIAQWFDLSNGAFNLLVLAGMTAFLSSVTRSPFTAAILVLEMTDRHSVIFYLMLAAMLGYLSAYFLEKQGIYDKFKLDYLKKVADMKNAK
ncbi:MAG TPA: chloride channel protein [Saprospiraceae bacterium]|nr:chloride channel protein [Saprospiraceae bacterium]HMQ85845.1 chloride channel protein [Saprospiraceae bacterium]